MQPSRTEHDKTAPVAAAQTPARRSRIARGTEPPPDGDERPWVWSEPIAPRLARRLITVPGLFLSTGLYVGVLPILLVYSAVVDGVRRRPFLLARFHLTMAGCLVWHIVGVSGLFLWWVAGLRWLGLKPKRWVEWNRALEGWWGHSIIGIAELFYGMKMTIRGQEVLTGGPVVVFSRHTSIIDTMLPLRILEYHNRMTARIVMKRELLWDPGVDSVSNRIPRTFVRRSSGNPAAEVEMVRGLARGMSRDEGVWIFPEGTRFSPKKRMQIINRLREKGDNEAAARAEELRYTLPPRPGGALALLDECRGLDVVFCAHTGMEGANRLENFIGGSLFNREVKVELWRVPADEVPEDSEEQIAWLHQWWKRMDRWVEEQQDPELSEMLSRE